MASDHHHHRHDTVAHHHDADEHLGDLLDLDAEVMQEHLSEATAWIDQHAARPVRQIIDLGCGTGAGTFALLRRFPDAEVTAVDASPDMLRRLLDKAHRLDMADRVHTVHADLDATWPDTGPADLAWASGSLHHLGDPDRVLAHVRAILRPAGLLAAVELSGFPYFLPADTDDGRLEQRWHAAADAERAERLPHIGDDWPARFARAGFTPRSERTFAIALTAPLPPAAPRYAEATLRRIRSGLAVRRLGTEDAQRLDALLDETNPQGVRRRTDLSVRSERLAWLVERT
ncbi:class I SAM-dependent methyltransferase [Mangrovihabitans endophyticus]|uniref:Methyltransferase domain-containing protein n=1 Tax=Mangrovihabitans endophyticus TaxID=1751298 RepID=A0A8J3C312_9ACTN|nr:class I SAM-dependent methyltransferase [Mangrovihabitans endophyticus]GGL11247.1 hypothetical protein GCM10012284_52490 [Mangrovihabitans endophyticus]